MAVGLRPSASAATSPGGRTPRLPQPAGDGQGEVPNRRLPSSVQDPQREPNAPDGSRSEPPGLAGPTAPIGVPRRLSLSHREPSPPLRLPLSLCQTRATVAEAPARAALNERPLSVPSWVVLASPRGPAPVLPRASRRGSPAGRGVGFRKHVLDGEKGNGRCHDDKQISVGRANGCCTTRASGRGSGCGTGHTSTSRGCSLHAPGCGQTQGRGQVASFQFPKQYALFFWPYLL